jgi:hypothetical protein
MDPIERLPGVLIRRSWLILGLMLLASLTFRNLQLTLGILCGGLVSIGGFLWLRRSLRQLLAEPGPGARVRYQFGYLVRLIALTVVLAALIVIVKIHTVGLIVGLAVVIVNLFWTTIEHSLRS